MIIFSSAGTNPFPTGPQGITDFQFLRFHKVRHPRAPCGPMFFLCLFLRLVEVVIPECRITTEKCEHIFLHSKNYIASLIWNLVRDAGIEPASSRLKGECIPKSANPAK